MTIVSIEPDESLEEARELALNIYESCHELPLRAEAFEDSVLNNTEEIMTMVEKRELATDKQLAALENMKSGIKKWL